MHSTVNWKATCNRAIGLTVCLHMSSELRAEYQVNQAAVRQPHSSTAPQPACPRGLSKRASRFVIVM